MHKKIQKSPKVEHPNEHPYFDRSVINEMDFLYKMKIDGQAGVLGLGFLFLVFMTLHIHTQSIFFKHKKIQKSPKVEHPNEHPYFDPTRRNM